MKKILSYILATLIVVISNFCYANPAILVDTFEDAVNLSKKVDLPILIVFVSDNCVHCNNLKKNMPDIENMILCFLKYEANRDLVSKFKVSSIPDSIVLDSNGKEIKRLVGFKDKKSYKEWLNKK